MKKLLLVVLSLLFIPLTGIVVHATQEGVFFGPNTSTPTQDSTNISWDTSALQLNVNQLQVSGNTALPNATFASNGQLLIGPSVAVSTYTTQGAASGYTTINGTVFQQTGAFPGGVGQTESSFMPNPITSTASILTNNLDIMPGPSQTVCPINVFNNLGVLKFSVATDGTMSQYGTTNLQATNFYLFSNNTQPQLGQKNGLTFINTSSTPGNFVSMALNNAVGQDSAGIYMVNVTTAGAYGGPIQREGRILFYTGSASDGFNAERMRIDESPLITFEAPTLLQSYTTSTLPATATNGTFVYCSNCKNVKDDTTGTFDSTAVSGGHGTMVLRENGAWRVH